MKLVHKIPLVYPSPTKDSTKTSEYTLPKFNGSPLKLGCFPQKEIHLPTIIFQRLR